MSQKRKIRSISIDQPISRKTKPTTQKVHINILLENASYEIIGFIILSPTGNNSLSLSKIRESIKSQFDDDQIRSLGDADTFKFVMDSIPIATKQETLVTIKEIAISPQKATKLIQQSDKSVTIPGSPISDEDIYFNSHRAFKKSPSSAPNSRHNSEDLHFDKVPHHYRYMGMSPKPSPSHLAIPIPSPNTKKRLKTHKKKVRSQTGFLSPFQLSPRVNPRSGGSANLPKTHKNTQNLQCYSIIVRSAKLKGNNFFRTLSNDDSDRDTSLSIFARPQMDITAMDTESDLSSNNSNSDSETTIGTDSQFSISPNVHTRLEQRFGGKLPRIRTQRTLKSIASDNSVPTPNKVSKILRDALVNEDQFKLKPMKSLGKISYTGSGSYTPLTMEFDDGTCEDSRNMQSLVDDKCSFTVIGSRKMADIYTTKKGSKDMKQRMWRFYDPIELMLGLQGLHQSKDCPVWMDIVCDASVFAMISEHIRPHIHTLTIEDCITEECREKLELFDNYLFICIDTNMREDSSDDKICLILFKHMIITYHNSETSDIVLTEARNRLEKRHKQKCPNNIGWVCHTIIDVIVDRMIPQIKCRVEEVQNVENLVFTLSSSQNELLQRLQIARNWLILYRKRLWTKSTMTYNLMQSHWRDKFLGGIQQQFWNDINDHVARMVDQLSLGQVTLESAQNIFVAKLSLGMSEQSNALSDGASRLTAVGSIFLPLSFLSAVWGMNCKVPFQYAGPGFVDDDYFGFMIVVTCMMFIGVFTYRYHIKFQ